MSWQNANEEPVHEQHIHVHLYEDYGVLEIHANIISIETFHMAMSSLF